MRHADASSTGIDKLLDSGKDGLNFFSTFIPRYKAWTGANPAGGDVTALTTRYDQQRGMDVEPLRAIGTTISQELNGNIGGAIQIQQLRLGELPSRWSGSPAADNAAQMAQRVSGDIGKEHDNLSGVAQALSAAAEQLENVVRTKADAVRTDFTTATTLAGKSADQIDKIIAYARGDFGGASGAEEQRTKARDILAEIGATDEPAAYSKRWLDNVFVPALDGKIAALTALTDATHTAVTGVYDQLGKALESLGASPYKGPDGQPSVGTGLQSGGPGSTQALFNGLPVATPASLTTTVPAAATAPAAASAPAASDGTDPSTEKPPVTPASALTGDAPPSQAGPIAATGPAAPADSGKGAPAVPGKGAPADPSEGAPTDPSQEPPTDPGQGAPTSGTDMGKAGEWRPGDIASVLTAASQITGKVPDILTHIGDPLQAVGETAKDFGDAFKSFVGTEGITGLVKEGVDATAQIDKLVDHHMHPGEVAAQSSNPEQSAGTQNIGSNSSPAQDNPQGKGAPTDGAAHPAIPPPTNDAAGQNEGRSIPGTTTPQPTTSASYSPAAATPNASHAMSPGGFLGGGHGSAGRSENEQEHRPKIQYVAPVREDGPAFVDAAESVRSDPKAADSVAERAEAEQPEAGDSDEMDSAAGDSEPEVKRA